MLKQPRVYVNIEDSNDHLILDGSLDLLERVLETLGRRECQKPKRLEDLRDEKEVPREN